MREILKKLTAIWFLLAPTLTLASNNLPINEESLILKEISRMRETQEENVVEFSSQVITPEKIKAFIAQPKFSTYDKMTRSNALIFAAQTDLLSFEKLSDIQQKMSAWFPSEINKARSGKENFFNDMTFFGPYTNWPVESMAFGALWECMPRSTWLYPKDSPYARTKHGYHVLFPNAIFDNSVNSEHFIRCFDQRVGRILTFDQTSYEKNQLDKKLIQAQVKPYLENRFEQHLKQYQCKLTGADDCVLVLSMWVALNPNNKKIEQFIPLIAPEVIKVKGDADIDAKLRKMAFLQAKMSYQLNHQKNIGNELVEADKLNDSFKGLSPGTHLNLGYFINTALSKNPKLHHQISGLLSSGNCSLLKSNVLPSNIAMEFSLKSMVQSGRLPCNYYLDKQALFSENNKNEALKKLYLTAILKENMVKERESYITEFLNYGEDCFSTAAKHLSLESKQICKRYVHEKQTTEFARMQLTKNKELIKSTIQFETSQKKTFKAANWIYKNFLPVLGKNTSLKLKNKVHDITETKPDYWLAKFSVWQHPEHENLFIHMQFYSNTSGLELWMIANRNGYEYIELPGRFKYRSEIDTEDIVKVTDSDDDGNLELWIHDPENIQAAEIFGENKSYIGDEHHVFNSCKYNESDLKRNIDCSLPLAKMGEINHGLLTYYAKNKPINKTPILSLFKGDKDHSVYQYEPNYCNELLIKDAIASKFTFNTDTDILGLACKENLMHPGRYLVSFFHAIHEDDFKLTLLDVDVNNKKVYHQYNRKIESDAITNPNNGGIAIDFIDVAENKKAIKLTLNINRYPRCVEATQDGLLTLLIEDKNEYRAILQDMVTNMWELTSGEPCGSGEGIEYTDENIYLELQPTANTHFGLIDFDVIHKHQINFYSETIKSEYKDKKIGRLEFDRNAYQLIKNSSTP